MSADPVSRRKNAIPTAENSARRLVFLFALFTIVPVVIVVLIEWNKQVLVWHFRIVDFIDLVVLAPFFAVILYALHIEIMAHQSGKLQAISLGLVALFLYGHAMHVTANSINTFVTEVHDYRPRIPDDAYDLIYFLDETLSHYLIFTALFALLLLWSHTFRKLATRPTYMQRAMLGLGLLQGGAQTIAMIEARKVCLSFGLAVILGAYIYWQHRKGAPSSPIRVYVRGVAIALILTLVLYAVVVGDYTSPSELY